MAAPNLAYPPATEGQLEQTGKMVEGAKRRWIPVKADIRDAKAMKEAVDRAVKQFGKLDIVVANAGIQAYGPLASTSEEDWNNVIDINVKGTANTVRAALPHMLSCKYGRIEITPHLRADHRDRPLLRPESELGVHGSVKRGKNHTAQPKLSSSR